MSKLLKILDFLVLQRCGQPEPGECLEGRDPVISHRILVENDAKLAKATGKCGEPLQTSAK